MPTAQSTHPAAGELEALPTGLKCRAERAAGQARPRNETVKRVEVGMEGLRARGREKTLVKGVRAHATKFSRKKHVPVEARGGAGAEDVAAELAAGAGDGARRGAEAARGAVVAGGATRLHLVRPRAARVAGGQARHVGEGTRGAETRQTVQATTQRVAEGWRRGEDGPMRVSDEACKRRPFFSPHSLASRLAAGLDRQRGKAND